MTTRRTPSQPNLLDVMALNKNYEQGAQNVRARFGVYEFIESTGPIEGDISTFGLQVLRDIGKLPVDASVLDVGTSDAKELNMLRIEMGHTGPLFGIDPNTGQFMRFDALRFTEQDVLALQRGPKKLSLNFAHLLSILGSDEMAQWTAEDNLHLHLGRAQELTQFEDGQINVLMALFMLYHVRQNERPHVFQEFNRVMGPDGVAVITTSGEQNKERHRKLEKVIADLLGIKAPPVMNAGFTSEKAAFEIPHYFKHVYTTDQVGDIIIDDEKKAAAYLHSIRSLYDQFTPKPDPDAFEHVLQGPITAIIEDEIAKKHRLKDIAHRSLFYASQVELDLPDGFGFSEISL